jgi:hypothetical protein
MLSRYNKHATRSWWCRQSSCAAMRTPATSHLAQEFRWNSWLSPPTAKDTPDHHNRALIGDDLCDFVDQKL